MGMDAGKDTILSLVTGVGGAKFAKKFITCR